MSSTTSLNAPQVKAMLLIVADAVIAAEPYLSEADRNLGDGDHGLGMARGFNAVKEKLEPLDPSEGIGKLFSTAGMAMISSMGGASGAIFGTLFREGGKALSAAESFDSEGLGKMLHSATEGVMARGKAKPGDKTMIDALHPAAAKAVESAGLPISEALAATAEAAEAGRDASKAMIATLGRAKTLGQASIGHPDAGACSIALILRTMSDFAAAPTAA
ncbi:MAG: dihydroxyacetone kinase, subunit [Verrucomicrobiales bacterium]|nr:dihydroxyacetone kinase, subunit [Verrucomicrobiales bacterium]